MLEIFCNSILLFFYCLKINKTEHLKAILISEQELNEMYNSFIEVIEFASSDFNNNKYILSENFRFRNCKLIINNNQVVFYKLRCFNEKLQIIYCIHDISLKFYVWNKYFKKK